MTTLAGKGFTLADARREFWKHPSPRMIAATLIAAFAGRVAVDDWQFTDAIVPVVMIAAFPFFEWVIHVCILHWRPRTVVCSRLTRCWHASIASTTSIHEMCRWSSFPGNRCCGCCRWRLRLRCWHFRGSVWG